MVGPTIARPGSMETLGICKLCAAQFFVTAAASAFMASVGFTVSSPGKYAIPKPPPKSSSGSSLLNSSRYWASREINRSDKISKEL